MCILQRWVSKQSAKTAKYELMVGLAGFQRDIRRFVVSSAR